MSGSSEPARVAMTRPSSGLKPMVVSTERPSRTAVAEAPPPMWHTTRRVGGAPSRAAARSVDHSTESPWKP